MNIEEFRDYCLSKNHVTESFPFDKETLVFKVAGKMFALAGLENHPATVNLKCDPEKALELREEHNEIAPGFHMSKIHWNTVTIDGNLSNKLIKELTDDSYNLVVKGLSKKQQKEIGFES
ncbi:MAG: MmcQ-like protein [Bacteroidetes bacterium HGW-Bacteroidetes-3]|jgi:predicted DNA-binding protein (MmcQ/YjbR family)|nr:MAG: MmcQ-like protein [Bacteroidetes bacterium HGW-Bacteroidetes-3]